MNARDNADMAEIARDRANAAYHRRLAKHPDPCDPEWPGHQREARKEQVIQQALEQAEVARDYLIRAISANNRKDPRALYRLLGAAQEELLAAFEILDEVIS